MQIIVCLCVTFNHRLSPLCLQRLISTLVSSYFPGSRFSSVSVDINSVFLRLIFDRGLVRIGCVCLIIIGLQWNRHCLPFCSPWIHSIFIGLYSSCYISLSSFSFHIYWFVFILLYFVIYFLWIVFLSMSLFFIFHYDFVVYRWFIAFGHVLVPYYFICQPFLFHFFVNTSINIRFYF